MPTEIVAENGAVLKQTTIQATLARTAAQAGARGVPQSAQTLKGQAPSLRTPVTQTLRSQKSSS
jgi:hypothetical protein